ALPYSFLCPRRGVGLWLRNEHCRPPLARADVRGGVDGVPEGINQTPTRFQREDRTANRRSRAHQPARAREVAVLAPTSSQPGGLVSLGRGGVCESAAGE